LTDFASTQPFNAFLSGFSATVGQFVLTVSLRMQTNPENKVEFESISHERYVSTAYLASTGRRIRDQQMDSTANEAIAGHLRTSSSAA